MTFNCADFSTQLGVFICYKLTAPDADFQLFVIQILDVVTQHLVEHISHHGLEYHPEGVFVVVVAGVLVANVPLSALFKSSCWQPRNRLLIDL